jgi:flagellar hook-associated protein 1
MADMLNVAVSGLRAFQRALQTTSHNIANASTPGYSRQRVDLVTQQPQPYGGYSIGNGVLVDTISRYSSDILTSQMQRASSTLSRLDAYADKTGALNSLFADSSTGLSASLQRFVNALQGVANTPSSTAARQVLLSEAEGFVQRLQTYDRRLDDIETEISQQLAGEAAAINSIAGNIARLNQDIVSGQARGGQASSDLLDARDKQINDLAARLDVNVLQQDDGSVNVFVGNGQPLVLGGTSAEIVAKPDAFIPGRMNLAVRTPGVTVELGSALSGGSVGGLLDFRREMLDPVRNQLGQMAFALAEVTNGQHREGIDLSGNMGGDLFAIGGAQVLTANTNTGSAVVAASRTSAGASTDHDYVLRFDGSAWTMQRADNGEPVSYSGTGTPASPIVAGGVSIVLSGAPAAGDRFLVRPTAGAIDGMDVLVIDPARVAAAAPIRSAAALANTGSAAISPGEVLDAGNAQLRSTVNLQFIDATHYSVNGVGSNSYTPGANIDINGWRVQISGSPQAGDAFTVSNNTAGAGDNRNALEMASALTRGVLQGGTQSLDTAVTRFVGSIGVAANQANTSRDAQQIIHEDSKAAVDGVAGVNLDEEAANMLRYQQAYQATAQMIRVTQSLFDTLMQVTSR